MDGTMKTAHPAIRLADWTADEAAIRAVRRQVFVVEQGIPESLDFDGRDPECLHALAFSKETPVATGRMAPDGHIGRLAVLTRWRHRGLGTAMILFITALARQRGLLRVTLNAQQRAMNFYRQLGFVPQGEPFMDAGIPHMRMERSTAP